MSWQRIDTTIPEKMSTVYGFRVCEILQYKITKKPNGNNGKPKPFKRFVSANPEDHTITILGKGERARTVHLRPKDYPEIVAWYKNTEPLAFSYHTLYKRLRSAGRNYPGQIYRSVTHRGRKDRYEHLPPDVDLNTLTALGEELGHGIKTAMASYNRIRIEQKKKELLSFLPPS